MIRLFPLLILSASQKTGRHCNSRTHDQNFPPVRREPRRPSFLAHLPLPADPLCAKEDRILPPPLVNEVHYHHQPRFVVFLLERIVAEEISLQYLLGDDFSDEDTGFLVTQAWLIDASYHAQSDIEEIGCEGRWIGQDSCEAAGILRRVLFSRAGSDENADGPSRRPLASQLLYGPGRIGRNSFFQLGKRLYRPAERLSRHDALFRLGFGLHRDAFDAPQLYYYSVSFCGTMEA